MFCQECGQKLPEGAKHCPYCGAMVEAAPPPEPEETSLKREEEGVPKEVLSPEPEDLAENPPPVKKTQKPKMISVFRFAMFLCEWTPEGRPS